MLGRGPPGCYGGRGLLEQVVQGAQEVVRIRCRHLHHTRVEGRLTDGHRQILRGQTEELAEVGECA